MIFISGVHGVGKSYFCDMVKAATGIESYSASTLITQKKHSGFAKDKLIPDIDDNQQYLLQAVNELKAPGRISFWTVISVCLTQQAISLVSRMTPSPL